MNIKKIALSVLSVILVLAMALSPLSMVSAMPEDLQSEMNEVLSRYNFTVGWGVYDISGGTLKAVDTYNAGRSFQSNCTIKAAMLLYICTLMDQGVIDLDETMHVEQSALSYKDFYSEDGDYTVRTLLGHMIFFSNNACYELFLRRVTKEAFSAFLASIGSGTRITQYNFMGKCTIQNRATEWLALYKYCHSKAEHASFAWKQLKKAKYSPIRDGVGRPVAHKVGWYYEEGTAGSAGDCAIVKTKNGGCYLMVIFTQNNARGKFSEELISEMAKVLDKVWNNYYLSIPKKERKKMKF